MTEFPDDADGAVLAELARHGVDLTQPLLIEFAVAAPDETSAEATLASLVVAGYDAYVEFDEGESDEDGELDADDEEYGPNWTVVANVRMIPTHAEIVRVQAELDRLAAPHDAFCDGWGVMLEAGGDA